MLGSPASFTAPTDEPPCANLSIRSGKLKVVDPSPSPKVAPIALKSRAYVVRLTALPSQTSHSLGASASAKNCTAPGGGTINVIDNFFNDLLDSCHINLRIKSR